MIEKNLFLLPPPPLNILLKYLFKSRYLKFRNSFPPSIASLILYNLSPLIIRGISSAMVKREGWSISISLVISTIPVFSYVETIMSSATKYSTLPVQPVPRFNNDGAQVHSTSLRFAVSIRLAGNVSQLGENYEYNSPVCSPTVDKTWNMGWMDYPIPSEWNNTDEITSKIVRVKIDRLENFISRRVLCVFCVHRKNRFFFHATSRSKIRNAE